MKLTKALLSVLLSALCASSVHAILYTDLDLFGAGSLVDPSHSLNGTFEINSDDPDGIHDLWGYDPGTEEVTNATATFFLHDDGLLGDIAPEKFTIKLGPDTFIDSQPVPFLFTTGGVTGNAFFDLSEDGVLAYSIVAVPNNRWNGISDFKVYSALLTVDARARAVPDGGTTGLLLGMGFLGLCVLQRKFASGH